MEDTRRRSLCRLRDAEVNDSYTAEYCRENCSAVLGEHPQSRVCFRPPKVSGLLLWAVIMMRRKNKKIQVYGKGTAAPVLSKGCRDLTRPSRDPIKRPAGRPVSFTTPVPLAVISNPSQSTAKLAQYARYRKSHEGLAPPGRFPLVNSTPAFASAFLIPAILDRLGDPLL